MKPCVFLVDDDRDILETVTVLLETAGHAVRAFGTAEAFDDFYRAELPGCLLLDIQLPGESGLELYARLMDQGTRLPVIFMTAHANVRTAVAAMKTGAIEFLEKPFERCTLLERVERALAVDAQWRNDEADYREIDQRIGLLSQRELETLELILLGEPNKRIAKRLSVTERAVEMRRAAIMRKLNVRSLAELLSLAVTHRLLAEFRQNRRKYSDTVRSNAPD